jgi:hypothetical protein
VAISFIGGGNLSTSSIMEKQISQIFLMKEVRCLNQILSLQKGKEELSKSNIFIINEL